MTNNYLAFLLVLILSLPNYESLPCSDYPHIITIPRDFLCELIEAQPYYIILLGLRVSVANHHLCPSTGSITSEVYDGTSGLYIHDCIASNQFAGISGFEVVNNNLKRGEPIGCTNLMTSATCSIVPRRLYQFVAGESIVSMNVNVGLGFDTTRISPIFTTNLNNTFPDRLTPNVILRRRFVSYKPVVSYDGFVKAAQIIIRDTLDIRSPSYMTVILKVLTQNAFQRVTSVRKTISETNTLMRGFNSKTTLSMKLAHESGVKDISKTTVEMSFGLELTSSVQENKSSSLEEQGSTTDTITYPTPNGVYLEILKLQRYKLGNEFFYKQITLQPMIRDSATLDFKKGVWALHDVGNIINETMINSILDT